MSSAPTGILNSWSYVVVSFVSGSEAPSETVRCMARLDGPRLAVLFEHRRRINATVSATCHVSMHCL